MELSSGCDFEDESYTGATGPAMLFRAVRNYFLKRPIYKNLLSGVPLLHVGLKRGASYYMALFDILVPYD
jgi:hypothetical protein